jgi:hypothetical protein
MIFLSVSLSFFPPTFRVRVRAKVRVRVRVRV